MAAPWRGSGMLAILFGTYACGSGSPAEPRTAGDDSSTSEAQRAADASDVSSASEAETDADATAVSLASEAGTDADGSEASSALGGAGDAGAEPDASGSACSDFANAYCQRYQACDLLAFALGFGDAKLCVTRMSPPCENQFGAPGGTLTVSALEACTRATAAESCAAFLSGDKPPECSWNGTEEAGAPCAYNLQCAEGFCFVPANTFCGTCRAPLQPGAPCDPNARQCANGLVCGKLVCAANGAPCPGATQWQCTGADGGVGDPCPNWAACAWPLVCDGTHCIQPPGLGALCDPTGQCDDTHGLYCAASPDGGGRTCDQATYVPAGMPCDLTASSPLLCSASAVCTSFTGTPSPVGTCGPAAADGQSCADALCVRPSICADKVCLAPGPAASCQ